jgi:hypothetical protein
MQRQQLVQDLRHYVPDNVGGMLGHSADHMDVEIQQTTTSCHTVLAHSPQRTMISVDVLQVDSAQGKVPTIVEMTCRHSQVQSRQHRP